MRIEERGWRFDDCVLRVEDCDVAVATSCGVFSVLGVVVLCVLLNPRSARQRSPSSARGWSRRTSRSRRQNRKSGSYLYPLWGLLRLRLRLPCDCGLRVEGCWLRIAGDGLRIADCGFRIA
eukprot:8398265-Alexandrium_andersonii.AAC.1